MGKRAIYSHLLSIAVLGVMLAGCATPGKRQVSELRRDAGKPTTIVVMPLDVELGQLTAGGIVEPHAEWTEAAVKHIRKALDAEAKNYNVVLIDYSPEHGSPEDQALGLELLKLHRAVGSSVILHQYVAGQALPGKEGKFDWSLGPSVAAIARSHEADYAMFLFVRDSYATGGRVAVMFVAAALGVGLQGGTQVGFTSIVDLKSGDVAWFNLLARGTGDLRTEEAAVETVRQLIADSFK